MSLAVAIPTVATIRLALWVLPSPVILRIVRWLALASAFTSHTRLSAAAIIRAIEVASGRIPRATCLTQALSAKLLLHLFGHDAQLCLGVARTADGKLRAHAWLERGGRPILGAAGIDTLTRLSVLPNDVAGPVVNVR